MVMKKYLGLFFLLFTTMVIASEKSLYDFSWLDKDKEVYVLQNRKFRKSGKLHVGTTFGRSLSGAFVDSNLGAIYGGFFLTENWGIEGSFRKGAHSTNDTYDAVRGAGTVAFYRKIDTDTTVHAIWSPFYSKINTFNKIIYYDWLFGLGLSSIKTLDNRNEFVNKDEFDEVTETTTAFSWMTGVSIFCH
jgi:hypothetical protein